MALSRRFTIHFITLASISAVLASCASPAPQAHPVAKAAANTSPGQPDALEVMQVANRITWGADQRAIDQIEHIGLQRYIEQQLHPGYAALPPAIQSQIAAMTITQRPMEQIVVELEQRRKNADAITSDDERQAAKKEYQQELHELAREAATRSLLRDLYSPNQLQEQMTWFWLNHFSVYQHKHDLRAMVGDYEDRAIRPHALGKFRDLLAATVYHPAMIRYLDNAQNAANHINENYAREIMELHTLGVEGGYDQHDVQELARILTGVGINLGTDTPNVRRRELQGQYVLRGLFEFNPKRHDYGDKHFLGHTIHGHGLAEVDEAIDLLSHHPSTARFISRKLAIYFVSDDPPPALVNRMAQTFLRSDGDIAAVLSTLFHSEEFRASLGHKFKDPVHYVVSSVRLAYGDKQILNPNPMLNWLNRMGEPLYGRQTPDGYPLVESAWDSPGQMTTRFDIAKTIGSGSAGLFKTEGPRPKERPAFPQLANALYYQSIQQSLSSSTRQALDQAASPQEWNTFLLASPEFMHR
jgi:uncharacterized protein (DUF1800 family)